MTELTVWTAWVQGGQCADEATLVAGSLTAQSKAFLYLKATPRDN